jgi:hypothetical protein
MQTIIGNDRINALVVALTEREAAKKVVTPEDNPFAEHTLTELSHGLMKGADNMPAVNMATKIKVTGENRDVENIEDSPGYQMEAARFETAREGKADKSARRMAQARARADRRVEFDRIAESTVVPPQERMTAAWTAVLHLRPIILKIAKSKQRWANRLLGGNADDIPSLALEQTALALARQEKFDLDVIVEAAEQLGKSENGVPGNQTVDENDPAHLKSVRKARKWLMGMVNNRVMGAVVDSYTSQANLRWENIDIMATVMASINGVGDDPLSNRFKADRAPAFLGTRFQRPDGIDADLLAMAIGGAITAHGLDPLVEFLLDEDNRRTDGFMKWSECAEQIFLLTPGGYGQWLWEQVSAQALDRRSRGVAARNHVRNLFEWLPNLIGGVVESFDPHFIGWSSVGRRAVMASDFELFYLPDMSTRAILQPALKFTTAREAAAMLHEHLACLTTGQDLVASVVDA